VISRLEDLDPESQAWVRRQLAKAKPLSEYQQARLESLFGQDDGEAGGDA
jgi:hypothetical protein